VTSEPDALSLTWTPRAAELADANLVRSRELGGDTARMVLAVVIALLAATMLTSRMTAALGVVLIVLALVLVFVRLTSPMLRRRWVAILAANPLLAETCEVTFDESGVHQSTDRLTSSRAWSTFSSWSDGPRSVLLAATDTALANVLVVPHRAAAGEEIEALRRVLETHVGPPTGSGRARASRRWVTWAARVVVVGCLVVPLGLAVTRVHDEGGEWRVWASEAPPQVTREGVTYVREGGPTVRPVNGAGVDYTPGGGLVLIPWPPTGTGPAAELWVLDHRGVVRHYAAETGAVAGR
jgi:hypothetical protein